MSGSHRILVVEDNPRVAALLIDLLEDADFEVDGPYATLSDGIAAVADHFPDGAILDVRLEDHSVDMLADDLDSYAIPYLFCSGFEPDRVRADHPYAPFVSKPELSQNLIPTLRRILH